MFDFIDIYSFIPVSGCVGRGPSALLCQGAYDAVETALHGSCINTINVFLPIYLDSELDCLSPSIPSKLRLNHIQVVSWFSTSKSPLCISLSVTARY